MKLRVQRRWVLFGITGLYALACIITLFEPGIAQWIVGLGVVGWVGFATGTPRMTA